ncbi:hypothetical protein V493_03974 [Pseudogymnoascus sp. VKM F-4281 (FW-2241)]|nr:hypothetical protein V493_03974 [Pseudogymnoascus sp. VKM F-4281 (FW-2241)]
MQKANIIYLPTPHRTAPAEGPEGGPAICCLLFSSFPSLPCERANRAAMRPRVQVPSPYIRRVRTSNVLAQKQSNPALTPEDRNANTHIGPYYYGSETVAGIGIHNRTDPFSPTNQSCTALAPSSRPLGQLGLSPSPR